MKRRIVGLDVIRSLAIILVVLNHSSEFLYPLASDVCREYSYLEISLSTLTFTLGRLGVPLFLFLTGTLLLCRPFEEDQAVLHFYKRNWLSLMITVEIWTLLLCGFSQFWNPNFRLSEWIKCLLFIQNVPLAQMWYAPYIIGLYSAIPFVACVVRRFSFSSLKYVLLISLIVFFLLPSGSAFFQGLGWHVNITLMIDASFLGGNIGFYVVIGYFIGKPHGWLDRVPSFILKIVLGCSISLTWLFQLWILNVEGEYRIWYHFILLPVSAACLFVLLKRVKWKNEIILSLSRRVSNTSFGMYFLHVPVQMLLLKHIYSGSVGPLRIISMTLLTLFVCLGILLPMSRSHLFNRYFLKNRI